MVQILLSCGCNPAAVAHNSKTAQQLASEEEHKEIVTILQSATAKVQFQCIFISKVTIYIYMYIVVRFVPVF